MSERVDIYVIVILPNRARKLWLIISSEYVGESSNKGGGPNLFQQCGR